MTFVAATEHPNPARPEQLSTRVMFFASGCWRRSGLKPGLPHSTSFTTLADFEVGRPRPNLRTSIATYVVRRHLRRTRSRGHREHR
jgi:hypothetical protein